MSSNVNTNASNFIILTADVMGTFHDYTQPLNKVIDLGTKQFLICDFL